MKYLSFYLITIALCTSSLVANADTSSAQEIGWEDLVPEGWEQPEPSDRSKFFSEIGLELDTEQASPSAPVVAALDNRYVKIPGFVLPVEFDGDQVSEFLLVPYVGACLHVPPPPGNQIVYVKLKETMVSRGLYDPVWVEGTLHTKAETSEYADAEYTLDGDKVTKYVWE